MISQLKKNTKLTLTKLLLKEAVKVLEKSSPLLIKIELSLRRKKRKNQRNLKRIALKNN
jgi:hypothetical protein